MQVINGTFPPAVDRHNAFIEGGKARRQLAETAANLARLSKGEQSRVRAEVLRWALRDEIRAKRIYDDGEETEDVLEDPKVVESEKVSCLELAQSFYSEDNLQPAEDNAATSDDKEPVIEENGVTSEDKALASEDKELNGIIADGVATDTKMDEDNDQQPTVDDNEPNGIATDAQMDEVEADKELPFHEDESTKKEDKVKVCRMSDFTSSYPTNDSGTAPSSPHGKSGVRGAGYIGSHRSTPAFFPNKARLLTRSVVL